MIHNEPLPLKNLSLWLLLVFSGLITAYLSFVAAISLWVGLSHSQQDGFWMPILVGTLIIVIGLWLFYRLTKIILYRTKDMDIINSR